MFKLALRHLLAKKAQTALILLGVTFGVIALTTVTGFFLGIQAHMVGELINNDGHLKITNKEIFVDGEDLKTFLYGTEPTTTFWTNEPTSKNTNNFITNPNGWFEILNSDLSVVAYSPLLSVTANITLAKSSVSASLIGNIPQRHRQVTTIGSFMKRGNFADLSTGGNKIIVGEGLVKKLGASLMQTIFVSYGSGPATPFKITGIFKTGNENYDNNRAYAYLTDVQQVAKMHNQVNEISVKFTDYKLSKSIAQNWSGLGLDKVRSWDQLNVNLLSVFNIQDALRYFVVTVVLIVAAFGVYNVLQMAVNQKKKEIAILRSMGFEERDVLKLFLIQGLIVGVLGGTIGIILGFLLASGVQVAMSKAGAFGGAVKISFDLIIYIASFSIAVLTAAVASLLPARAASRLTPIQIIRMGTE